ncbi:MAG: M20/M25/M40 family metallo-hydrolase [Archangium sp.]|nr:M20/M25/M40 family metallo-hydrolase [Archangium sp.]
MRTISLSLLLLSCAGAPRALHAAPAGVEKYSADLDFTKAGDEAVEVLQGYLRVDTFNPPGNETLGAEYLKAQLAKDGLESQVHEFAPGRGSLVARLKASKPSGEKPLCLLSHIDVVPAETELWPKDQGPLSGALVDGMIWGRGALDMKGMGALELQTFRWLARKQVPLHRDVILLAVADEEVAEGGMKLVTEQLWTDLDCGHVINEGGMGVRGLLTENQTAFAISVGEKGILWLRVTAEGEAGHGSTPTDNRAPTRLVAALEKLAARQAKPRIQPAMYELLRRVGEKNGGVQGFVMQHPSLVDTFAMKKLMSKPQTRAGVTDTCQVTGFDGKGSAPNVIPSQASAIMDCRLLPGTTPKMLQAELEGLVKDLPGIKLEVVQAFDAAVSEMDDAFFDALARHAVAGRDDAVAGPVISPGYTDSILARAKGARAYGFVPFEVTPEELATFHGRDERVSVKNVHRGLEILFKAVVDVAAIP